MRDTREKILSREAMRQERERLRGEGKIVVFTNGCFDIFHAGHVDLIEFARRQGDVLVVGVNSDASVRRIKGAGRPIIPDGDRTRILAALEAVDYVVVFDEDRVDQLISEIRPDILVKGAQWGQEVHGREIVERDGGRVVLAPMREGRSTTNIVEKIRNMGK
ncbi:MAG: D-glycero-beta-D-manno-heptose 1-phosphate adenylyltransferase [Kiritimatiellia bacterium]